MPLPKKINPANIKEAVVDVRYLSDVPFEVLVGIFYNVLIENYTYTNRPSQQQPAAKGLPGKPVQEITIKVGNTSLFYNDKVSLQVLPNSLVFSWLNHYSTWQDYQPEIAKTLEQLFSTGRIKIINRVGVRYISEYPGKDLRDCIKFKFSFGLPQVESETTAFRSEFIYNGTRIILNLNNKVPFLKPNPETKQLELSKTSIIDIDVIKDKININSFSELLNIIEDNHTKEKEIFFGMMDDEYLASLNPEY